MRRCRYATATGSIRSRFGWRLRVTSATSPRTLANFPAQANGSEVLRLALVLLVEAGIQVCITIHDAVLIQAPMADLADTIALAQRLMAEASAIVLDGFPLRTDAAIIRWPDRYDDPRGRAMVATLARRDRLDKAVVTMAAEPDWARVVARLGCLCGVGTLTCQ